MMPFNLEEEGYRILHMIKYKSWFPYKSGKLKFEATSGQMYTETIYAIRFSSSIAPYVEYLEEGTSPHDILGAFIGKEKAMKRHPPFGVGGRFDGKFHPGSTKHVGFIKNKCVGAIVEYIRDKYDGIVEVS